MRASRTIRERLAAKRKTKPTIVKQAQIDAEGLTLDDIRFPHWVAPEIKIDRIASDLALINIGIYTENARINSIPPHATITETLNPRTFT